MGLPGEIRITQLLALPSNDTFYRPGYASPAGRHEKVPAALAGRGRDIRSHLCQGGHGIFAYLATGSRMPILTSICPSSTHLRPYHTERIRDTHAVEENWEKILILL
jgi:hypothetical protein